MRVHNSNLFGKSRQILLVLTLFTVLVISVGLPESSAAKIEYEPNGFVLLDIPTVCSLAPKDPTLTSTQIEKLMEQTRLSVDEWKVHLKNAANKKNWDNWIINYKNIDGSSKSSEFLDCDILIYYSPFPPNPEENFGVLGVALGNEDAGKSFIEIYYHEASECEITETVDHVIYHYRYPCYQDVMVSSELGAIIRHEIGHALGLGHYASGNTGLSRQWAIGSSPSPSIMVEMMFENQLPANMSIDHNLPDQGLPPTVGQFPDESDTYGLAWAIENSEDEIVRARGSAYWAGIANSYYTVDKKNGIAIVYFTQFFPFNDKESYDFYRLFENETYSNFRMN